LFQAAKVPARTPIAASLEHPLSFEKAFAALVTETPYHKMKTTHHFNEIAAVLDFMWCKAA